MSPTALKALAILLVIAPIAGDVISQLQGGQFVDWGVVLKTVVAALSGALGGSQLIKRLEDTTPKKLEQKVEAQVAERVSLRSPE